MLDKASVKIYKEGIPRNKGDFGGISRENQVTY
jgi:hypothetical protein